MRRSCRQIAKHHLYMTRQQVGNGRRIYIITEWDREMTSILLPAEY